MPPSLPLQKNEVLQFRVGGRLLPPPGAPGWGAPGDGGPYRVGSPGGLADSRPGIFSTVLNPGESCRPAVCESDRIHHPTKCASGLINL